MGGENAVRVCRHQSAHDLIEGHIVFNLDRRGGRPELHETLNQIIPLGRGHFHFRLGREIIIQNGAVVLDHQPVDDVMAITNGVLFGGRFG